MKKYVYIYITPEFFKGGSMEKFKRALRTLLMIAILSGAVYAIATQTAPGNAYGSADAGC